MGLVFNNTIKVYIIYFCIIPVIVGFLIYFFFRERNLFWNTYLLNSYFDYEAIFKYHHGNQVQKFLIYNFPNSLWIFSFTVSLGLVWKDSKSILKYIYLIIPLFVAILSESFQKIGYFSGTFDYLDVIAYVIGALNGILICYKFSNKI